VLLAQPELALLEVGPGQTLTALSRQNPAWQQAQPVIASSPRTCKDPETDEFLAAIAQLWVHGVKVDWAGLRHGPAPQRLSLPGYAFQRKRHWIEPHRSTPTPVELDFATNGMNGNGAHEANGHVPSSAVEALIDEQLQIMARQIDVLRHHTAGGHVA
jgi:phthiocerol/phenolphthiocerol synthesis type-I polyketide synthase E